MVTDSTDFKFIFYKYDSLINYLLKSLTDSATTVNNVLTNVNDNTIKLNATETIEKAILESAELEQMILNKTVDIVELSEKILANSTFKDKVKTWFELPHSNNLTDYLQNRYKAILTELPHTLKLTTPLLEKSIISMKMFARNQESQSFSVDFYNNLGHIVFHFNPRYIHNIIARNSFTSNWQTEERALLNEFPYVTDKEFYITHFHCTQTKFVVTVNEIPCLEFLYRDHGVGDITQITVNGSLTLVGLDVLSPML
ncbi:Galactose-binding lectin [Lymphocystis disease virus 1]|uniref:Galactose-binding lectin n=1 Tax=Fish lymphocystis disease virus TaxID=36363 RepID=UPI0000161EC6|nr:Galactose-binding lectin [Lymphocystis disease virus 1]